MSILVVLKKFVEKRELHFDKFEFIKKVTNFQDTKKVVLIHFFENFEVCHIFTRFKEENVFFLSVLSQKLLKPNSNILIKRNDKYVA